MDDGVRRALAAAPHRGSTVDVAIHGSCALGISTSADPVDAWLARTEDFTIALTGNLDNVEELATQLRADGRPIGSTDPACVVAELFRSHGELAPSKMRGVFAVVVTDGVRLWCFRDQVGYRTLFHRVDEAGATIASEAKQVVAGSGIAKEPDLAVLERQFFGNYGNATSSALSGVARLPKATILRVDAQRADTRRYWQPEDLLERARFSPGEIQERFDALMTQACARTLVGPDAVSLSGGIDSPAIAA
jgi:asparagine synthetase B (glutamine-hydrolysing)